MKTQIVRGEVLIPAGGRPTAPADVTIYVEDVSRADAPSVVVGEQQFSNITLPSDEPLKFEIEVPEDKIDERRIYSVRAHIDSSRTGEMSQGDLISTQSYPVLTRGHGKEVRVNVKRI